MEEFYRIRRLPPYVFEQVNRAKAAARNAGADIIDLGMGNPDLPAPPHVLEKLKETLGNQDAFARAARQLIRPADQQLAMAGHPLQHRVGDDHIRQALRLPVPHVVDHERQPRRLARRDRADAGGRRR